MANKSNLAKGKNSYDANVGNSLVTFFNKNVTPYPTEVGGPKFDLVPVTKQKDLMINAARMYAQQEYDRIMELVKVLQKQALEIKDRLEMTDAVHAAKYDFQLFPGQIYWVAYDSKIQSTRLCHQGPKDWTTGVPESYQYLFSVKWLGDNTFIKVEDA